MKGYVSLFLLMMTCLSVSGTKRKFAPAYCIRLRFNCQRDSHAGHICCKFPLPEGEEAEKEAQRQPHPFIKIRPIGIRPHPIVKEAKPETEEGEEILTESSDNTSTTTTTSTTSRPSNPGRRPRPALNAQPRICQRISVNCEETPDHRCCSKEASSTTSTTTTTTTTPLPKLPEEYQEYTGEYEYSDEIPEECYTAEFDCEADPNYPCCAFITPN
eukprot:TRINITY_DN1853_c0_g1_i1.p1 TRINITY_DN1853_c0_g1~~TRINITY_DN1853_c0_g1_i1.p1  ORF type:complete len:215 (-),score=41.42 TRINITY_DN1853_c0_g1_i1:91-735(-)